MSDTPVSDMAARKIGACAARWKDGSLAALEFANEADALLNPLRELERENVALKKGQHLFFSQRELPKVIEQRNKLERENARLQMELDASCNAEELRQVRAENAALKVDRDRLLALGETEQTIWPGFWGRMAAKQCIRAEKLERENAALEQKLHALRLICGTTDANKFQTRLDLILEENIALQADKERLDWLAVSDHWFDEPATESFTPETFRVAIDNARKEQP